MIKLQFLGFLLLAMIYSFGTYAQKPDTLATFDFDKKTQKEKSSEDKKENLSPEITDSTYKTVDRIVGLKRLIYNSISDAFFVVRQDYLPDDSLGNGKIQATYSLGVANDGKIMVLKNQLELNTPGMRRSKDGLAYKNIRNFRFIISENLSMSMVDSNYNAIKTQSELTSLASSAEDDNKQISGMVMVFYYDDQENVDASKIDFDIYEIGMSCSETDCVLEEKPNFPKNKFLIGSIYLEVGSFDFSEQGISTDCCKRKCKETCEKLNQNEGGFLRFKVRGFLDPADSSKKRIIPL